MADITDKFGKASIDTNYAQATTVKTARTPGETVLAAFDLSKFSPDTPVFFITYKKVVDPTTNEATVVNQTSWKAIVNPDINTLTNLTLAPGYTDVGNEVGDYIECIPTSFWTNELVDGIQVSHKPDGTLKDNSVTTAALAANAVNTSGIADGAVTPKKRAGGFKIGIIPASTFSTTGNKSITGVGFKPRLVRFTLMPSTGAVLLQNCWGAMAEGGSQYLTTATVNWNAGSSRTSSTSRCIGLTGASSTTYAGAARYSSMDNDGFTINVVTSGLGQDVAYEAYA